MSCYEWESGTIKLPSSEATKLKKLVRDEVNRLHETTYQNSREWVRKYGAAYRRRLKKSNFAYPEPAHLPNGTPLTESELLAIESAKGRMPRRDQITPRKATNRDTVFEMDDFRILFNGRELEWRVFENNHACDRAHAHPVAQALFRALDQITWTRGSGGKIVGNDEYNRCSTYEGGGANYLKHEYGYQAQKRQREQRRRYGSYGVRTAGFRY